MSASQDPAALRVDDLLTQGFAALHRQEAPRAMGFAQKALALRAADARCHHLAGEIYQHMGKAVLAQRAFARAAALDPAGRGRPAELASIADPNPPAASGLATLPGTQSGPQHAMPALLLTPPQRYALANKAGQCLNKVVHLERRLNEISPAGGAVYDLVKHERLMLMELVHQARLPPPSASAAASFSLPGPAADLPAGYLLIPPFTQTLGTSAGALKMGPSVAHLQRLLTLEGFAVAATGRFDQATTQALQRLQAKYGLPKRDGIVGGETRRLLNRLIGKDSAPT